MKYTSLFLELKFCCSSNQSPAKELLGVYFLIIKSDSITSSLLRISLLT